MKIMRDIDLPGQVIVSWFTAGAILTGGVLVAYGTLNETFNYYYILYAVAGLYIVGGFLGFLFGGAMGMFGRPIAMTMKKAFKDQLMGTMYVLPAAAIGFVIAGWLSFTMWALYSLNWLALMFVAGAWFIAAIIVAIAINRGWLAAENVWNRAKKLGSLRIRLEYDD